MSVPVQPIIQPSFAGGELSPSLAGRVDLAKYRVGARRMRNFHPIAQGGAATRPGTIFVGRCKSTNLETPPRLIPFTFSTIQDYILEFGDGYMRVIMNAAAEGNTTGFGGQAGYVLEPALAITAVSQGDPATFTVPCNTFADGDQLFLSGLSGVAALNSNPGRQYLVANADPAAGTFTLTDLDGTAVSTAALGPYTGGGNAARVYTLATPYALADLPLLKFTQSADILTLCHPDYPAQDLTRTAHWAWTLEPITFAAAVASPTGLAATPVANAGGTQFDYAYVVTALKGGEESLPSAMAQCTNSLLNQNTGVVNNLAWTPVAGADSYNVYKASFATTAANTGTVFGYIGQSVAPTFSDAQISPDYSNAPPSHSDPFADAAIQYVTDIQPGNYTSPPTPVVTDATGSGFVGYSILQGTGLVAVVVVDGGKNWSANAQLSFTGGGGTGGGAGTLKIGPASGNAPGCVAYYQGRKLFAGSQNQPDTVWMSKSGAYTNMDSSSPSKPDDAITITLETQQVNAVKHLVSMNALLALTSSGAWQISPGPGGAYLSPTTVVAAPQAYNGAADVPPLVINTDILYVQNKGAFVRDLSWNFYVQLFTGNDITVMADHLFFGRQIREWCWAEEPWKLVWAVRDDGVLLTLNYLKSQDIYGWSWHDTQGLFHSVASISEGAENAVYVVASRTVPGVNNGQPVQYVERLHSRNLLLGDAADVTRAWCVDCGAAYPLQFPASRVTPAGLTLTPATPTAAASWSGTGTLAADQAVFGAASVGAVVRINGGVAQVTACIDSQHVAIQTVTPLASLNPALSGFWTCTPPVTVVTGLDHLEGALVSILAGGNVEPPQVVTNGQITLSVAQDVVVVGLPYTCQLQTMSLELGEPTAQGRRKKIAAVTLRLRESRGLKVGPDALALAELKERGTQPYGQPIPLVTADERLPIPPAWGTDGTVFVQQDNPLPATVLAIIPEVLLGDSPG